MHSPKLGTYVVNPHQLLGLRGNIRCYLDRHPEDSFHRVMGHLCVMRDKTSLFPSVHRLEWMTFKPNPRTQLVRYLEWALRFDAGRSDTSEDGA
jgi:hypothetical protein